MQGEHGSPNPVEVASCNICGRSIRLDPSAIKHAQNVLSAAQAALREHVEEHSPLQVAHYHLRVLAGSGVREEFRPPLLKAVFGEILAALGEDERRGPYTVDDALGGVELYRLWHDAHACTSPVCRHAA